MSPLKLAREHAWNLSPDEAIELQQELRTYVKSRHLDLSAVRTVGGLDTGFPEGRARAAAVVLSYPDLEVIEEAIAEVPVTFPYSPGLLSFREAPAILAVLEKLQALPDVLILDGQGIAHPRRFGIASHIGVLLEHPTIGCAKSILTGKHAPLAEERGSVAALTYKDEVIGAALRTKTRVKPVYISTGNLVDLVSAVDLVLACGRGYRLPEPTRLADRLASHRDAR